MNVAPMGVYTAQILIVLLAATISLLGLAGLVLSIGLTRVALADRLVLALLPTFRAATAARTARSDSLQRVSAPSRAPPLLILRACSGESPGADPTPVPIASGPDPVSM